MHIHLKHYTLQMQQGAIFKTNELNIVGAVTNLSAHRIVYFSAFSTPINSVSISLKRGLKQVIKMFKLNLKTTLEYAYYD